MINFTPQIAWNHSEVKSGSPTAKVSSATKAQVRAQLIEEGRKYIISPSGNLILENGLQLYRDGKHVDDAKDWGDTVNTIARDLTYKIKRKNERIIAKDIRIKKLEELLFQLASRENIRKALKYLRGKHHETIQLIELGGEDPEMEESAQVFYEDFVAQTGMKQAGLEIIKDVSWAGEDTYKHYEYSCYSWVIIVGIMRMIKL